MGKYNDDFAPAAGITHEDVKQGNVFSATTQFVEVSGEFNFLFDNPTGSGVRAYIFKMTMFNDTQVIAAPIESNADTNLPTNSTNPTNAKGDAPAPACDFLAEDMGSAMSGGTLTGDVLLSTTDLEPSYIHKDIAPGVSLGSNTGAGTLSSPSVYAALWWYEYPP